MQHLRNAGVLEDAKIYIRTEESTTNLYVDVSDEKRMWMLFALLSAIFAAITSIFARIGIRNIDSNLATAIRTIVVLAMAWLIVLIIGSFDEINQVSERTLVFLVLSGISTGASWLCYFRAIQMGNVNKVAPIDKSSTILTIILAFILLGEPFSAMTAVGMVVMFVGTMMMIEKKDVDETKTVRGSWLLYAVLSAIFAALTSILGKVGIEDIESNLGTAIRTTVVLIMAWIVVFSQGSQTQIHSINRHDGSSLCFPVWPLVHPGYVSIRRFRTGQRHWWFPSTSSASCSPSYSLYSSCTRICHANHGSASFS